MDNTAAYLISLLNALHCDARLFLIPASTAEWAANFLLTTEANGG